jgi:hypothetical protein
MTISLSIGQVFDDARSWAIVVEPCETGIIRHNCLLGPEVLMRNELLYQRDIEAARYGELDIEDK